MYTTSIQGLFRYKCSQCPLVPYHNYPMLYSHLRWAARPAVEPASSGAGLSWAVCITGQQGRGLNNQRTLENSFLIQLKLLIYCSTIHQAKHFLLCPPLCQEKWCTEELSLSVASFLSPAGMWTRSSPLVYWLQTICDYMGLWLLRLRKQEMQSIDETHRTVCFVLFSVKCVFISASIFRDQDLRAFEKNLSLNVLLHCTFKYECWAEPRWALL